MKKRKENSKKSKTKKSSNKKIEKDVTKQVGIFNDFLVFDKIDEAETNKFNFLFNEPSDPFLKDWLIIQPKNKPTQSRFSNLFQEILENDKKLERKKKNINLINNDINEINEIDIEDEKLLPNNLIEENDDEEIKFENDENFNIEEKMKNLSINDSRSDIRSDISFDSNYSQNSLKNINILSNSIINNTINNLNNNKNNINNIKIPNNNFMIMNNNNNNLNNIMFTYAPNINTNNTLNNFNSMNNFPMYFCQDKKFTDYTNSGFPSPAPTAPSSMENYNRTRTSSFFSVRSNSSGSFGGSGDGNNIINNNNYDYYNISYNKTFQKEPPPSRSSEKKFDLNIDIKRILSLEDRRTTLMIKNIPNKFKRDLLLKTINENFKGAYDLFILPTDANGYKNFGYSFINFTSSYYIPYFYFLFHHKKWSSTNSQKICEITYSKIQGRSSLLSHYQNKITFKNNELKKLDNDIKYIIPNEYRKIFNSIYPNYIVEKYETYFVTKMPFRY